MNTQAPVSIRALMNPALYDHPVSGFELVETHISWVLLTGSFAYKIKKPVDLGFLDFTTLAKRRHYCNEELRLNRRLAPHLYLDVVAITGAPERPAIGGAGAPIEYAVKMRQFDNALELDKMIRGQGIGRDVVAALARVIARFHAAAEAADAASMWGDPDRVLEPVIENFDQLDALSLSAQDSAFTGHLRAWSIDAHHALAPRLAQRKRHGCVRECHGDLHLGNIALIDGDPVPFDCLEFNPALRWIDVISEIAFLFMDLDYHERPDLALRFLNDYLHHGGDYSGLACLRYYLVYRAMVRAKVAGIRAGQCVNRDDRNALLDQMRRHVALAETYTRERRAALIITHGLSGCGKTTLTDDLLAPCHALRVRSDVERKRLHGLTPEARSASAPAAGIYGRDASRMTYGRLAESAAAIIGAGFTAIVDATFLERARRDRFRELARELDAPFLMLDITAPEAELRARIGHRMSNAGDASEAGLEILSLQLRNRDPLGQDERVDTLAIDTGLRVDGHTIAAQILERLPAIA